MHHLSTLALSVAVAALSASCSGSAALSRQNDRVPAGEWGGEHVSLTVTSDGAHFEFDCAQGDISGPLVRDASSTWTADGTLLREPIGAIRLDQPEDRQPARYTGRVSGDTMTVDVRLRPSNELFGTFTLKRDETPRVRKCR